MLMFSLFALYYGWRLLCCMIRIFTSLLARYENGDEDCSLRWTLGIDGLKKDVW